MSASLRFRVPTMLAVAAGVIALGVAASLLVHWIVPLDTFAWVRRLGPGRVLYSAALFGAWGAADIVVAIRDRQDLSRALQFGLAVAMFIQGTVSAAAFDPIGAWLTYAGLIGLVGSVLSLSTASHPIRAALGGAAGGLLMFAIGWLGIQPFV